VYEVLLESWLLGHDTDAFAALVSRHSRMICATAKRVLSSEAIAAPTVAPTNAVFNVLKAFPFLNMCISFDV